MAKEKNYEDEDTRDVFEKALDYAIPAAAAVAGGAIPFFAMRARNRALARKWVEAGDDFAKNPNSLRHARKFESAGRDSMAAAGERAIHTAAAGTAGGLAADQLRNGPRRRRK